MSDDNESPHTIPPTTTDEKPVNVGKRRRKTSTPSQLNRTGLEAPAEVKTPHPTDPGRHKSAEELHEWKLRLVGGTSIAHRDDATIKQWLDRKAVELLPAVLADLAFDLKYGTDKARAEARDRVLDMHGLRKREAAAGNHATIVLNLGGDQSLTAKLPWLGRADKAPGSDE